VPAPGRRATSPSAATRASAARAVWRLTSWLAQSSRSVGSSEPIGYSPRAMPSMISSASVR
jgi:hypothetical protein